MDEPIIQPNTSNSGLPQDEADLEIEPELKEETQDLSALSPMNVLRRSNQNLTSNVPPPPPLIPVPVPPPPPPPIMGSSTPISPPVSDNTFIIPPRAVLEEKIYPPTPQVPQPSPISSPAPIPTPVPVVSSITAPQFPQVTQMSQAVPAPIIANSVLDSESEVKPVKRTGLIATMGVLVALLVIVVTAYALASSGSRVPYLYTKLSGIKADGIEASQTALNLVKTQKNYLQSGELLMNLKEGQGLATPSPSPTADSSSASLLSGQQDNVLRAMTGYLTKLDGKYDGIFWSTEDNSIQSAGSLNTDSVNQDISYTMKALAGQNWKVYLASNIADAKAVNLSESDMRQNLLFNIFRPIPLTTLLDSAKKEVTFQKTINDGKEVSVYTYSVDLNKLANWLPDGAVLDSTSSLAIYYVWGTALPNRAVFAGKIKYQGLTYNFSGDFKYSDFGKSLADPLKTKLSPLNNLTKESSFTSEDANTFVSHFGIDPVNLPKSSVNNQTTGSGDNKVTIPSPGVTPSPSVSPTASATPSATSSPTASATPSATPTATPSTAIVPTGESISQVESSLTQAPIAPSQTVSDAAKLRDTQRKEDLSDLGSALNAYKSDHGSYPSVEGTVQTINSSILFNALVPKYLTKMPVDPLAHTYWYGYSSNGISYQLTSVAEDYTDSGAQKGQSYYYYYVKN